MSMCVRWVRVAVLGALALQSAPASAAYVNSLTGAVTDSELQATAAWFKANPYTPTGNNQGNNFAYGGGAQQAGRMANLYEMTGDVWFLDQMIRFSDHILSVRNDNSQRRQIWTGRVEICWPNKTLDAGDAAYCGTENGYVLGHMLASSKAIAQHPELWNQAVGIGDPRGYGATYIQRARKFLTEANRTYDEFLIRYFVNPTTNRLHLPTHAGWAAMPGNYAKDQGNGVPWNQQDMVTAGLRNGADTLMALGEDSARVTRYDTITRASITWFTSELEQFKYTKNGVTVYLWGYPPGGAQRYPEDLSHASADINHLYGCYKLGRFGVSRTYLEGIGNTFMEVIRLADGTFAGKVNGGGTPRASVSASWSKYNQFRSGIYPVQFQQDELDAAKTNAESALGILGIRRELYGMGATPRPTPTPTPTVPGARPTVTPTPTPTPCTGCGGFSGYYRIMARHSGKAVVVAGVSTADGANVYQWDYNDNTTDNDEWELRSIGSGFYRVINRHSGKDLTVVGASTANGGDVVQFTYGGTTANDEWQPIDLGNGYHRVVNRHSGKVLNVAGASTINTGNVDQWAWANVNQQQFQLISIP
jgi:hypothetical protein